MLGWCPPSSLHNRPSSGQSFVPQSHEIAHHSTFDDEKPVLQPPHQVVIGFDLGIVDGSKSLNTQACKSPRSVLEPQYCRPQSGRSPGSPLSALGSLLADRACVRNNAFESTKISGDVHAYHNAVKSEHAACVERVGSYKTSDTSALSQNNWARASKTLTEDRPPISSVCREVHGYHRFNIFLSSDDEDECEDCEIDVSKSIFCAASPVSHCLIFDGPPMDFLSYCFRCRRQLMEGKDVYMYRGDQAFCSQECRHKQILIDERKHRSPVVTPCFSRVTSDHRGVARAAQAAFV